MTKHFPTVALRELVAAVERPESPAPGQMYRQVGVQLWGRGAYEREALDGGATRYMTLSRVEADDIIVNKIWARNGSVAVVPVGLAGCYVSGEFPTFRPIREKLDPRWFHWYSKTPALWNQCDEKSRGTSGKNRIRPEKFLEIEIPLPSLDEQRRIVSRIEELAAKIEEARHLRGNIAQKSELLLICARNEVFAKLSKNLTPTRLDSVADCRLGKMLSGNQAQDGGGTPYLRNANVQWDRLDLRSVYRMNVTDEERKSLSLQPGDVLVCEGGDIGKTAIWNDEIPGCIYQKALHRIRVDRNRLMPRFLLHHIFWAAEQGHFSVIKTQTTIPHLTGVKLRAYAVYLPSTDEQRHIVAYLGDLQAKVDALKKLQSETAAELDALMPSILAKAFRAEL